MESNVGDDWYISASVGTAIVIAGLLLMRSHVRQWSQQQDDPELDERQRRHLHWRYRRRMQASGLLTLIGIMIPVGDIEALFGAEPVWFAVYWFVVIGLVIWVALLALGDLAVTRAHSQVDLKRLEQMQRELEQELATLKSRSSNGRESE